MPPASSVSQWLDGVKAGDSQAAAALWQRYCDRLLRMARKKLGHALQVVDEEDIALSAFNSLCLGARAGRFPALADRNSLWGLLVFITAQKAANWNAYNRRQKRDCGKAQEADADFDRFLDSAPGPDTLNIWAAEYERLLQRLGGPALRQIAELRVQGHTVDEIAEKLDVARRTVHRKLDLIRKIWAAEGLA
jgi:DNA-directed RNA polymerase specialized sigma24 family protein